VALRVSIDDRFLVRVGGIKRIGTGIYENRIVDLNENGNPFVMCREVQQWLHENIGYRSHARHDLDIYYYPGDPEPSYEELKEAWLNKSSHKLSPEQRRYRFTKDNAKASKSERFIWFADDDEELAVEFMLRFSSEPIQKNGKGL
jgi:hypothetical protein